MIKDTSGQDRAVESRAVEHPLRRHARWIVAAGVAALLVFLIAGWMSSERSVSSVCGLFGKRWALVLPR